MNSTQPLKSILVMVLTGTALGIGSNLLHPKPIPWVAEKKEAVSLEQAGRANKGPGPTENDGPQVADPPTPVPRLKPMKSRFGKTETAPADLYADIPESDVPIEIGLAKIKEFYDRGGLLILDARERESFAEGRIRGAVYAYTDEVIGEYEWMEETAADPRPIVAYCDGGECELSHDLGFELARLGHKKVLIFVDGFPSWRDAGYPVETGEVP